eukprot:5815655-Alexandrium_andersonii.AAC.1
MIDASCWDPHLTVTTAAASPASVLDDSLPQALQAPKCWSALSARIGATEMGHRCVCVCACVCEINAHFAPAGERGNVRQSDGKHTREQMWAFISHRALTP